MKSYYGVMGVLLCALCVTPAVGQDVGASAVPPGTILADSASPFPLEPISAQEEATMILPALAGTVSAADEADFDKYYYFRRSATDLQTAFADISECDSYAQGMTLSQSSTNVGAYYYPYGVIGILAVSLADAIMVSAEKRTLRREVMRNCMGFKGYDRHGLSKKAWQYFNFEEAVNAVDKGRRRELLIKQAGIAARGPAVGKVLEP